jgi:Protein of unknown function (DUF2568)
MNRAVNLTVAFLIEVVALVAFAWWGFHLSEAGWVRALVGVGVPIVTAVAWGLFLAPRATFKLPRVVQLVLKAVVFGAATAAIIASSSLLLGIVFAAIVVVNTALIRIGNLDEGVGR